MFVEEVALTELADIAERIERGERFSRTTAIGDAGGTFVEDYGPPPRLLVFGAVDTAEALSAAAKQLGWETIVADARGKFATAERIPSADELLVEWPDDALARVQPDEDTAVVVLTHEDRFDIPALKGALETDAFYVGALGARRNQERRRERLLEAGVGAEDIDRIAGPAGPRHRRRHGGRGRPCRSSRRSSPAAPGAPAARSRTVPAASTPSSSQNRHMAHILCVLYDDPVDGYPPAYARDGVPEDRALLRRRRRRRRPRRSTSRPASCSAASPASSGCAASSRSAATS